MAVFVWATVEADPPLRSWAALLDAERCEGSQPGWQLLATTAEVATMTDEVKNRQERRAARDRSKVAGDRVENGNDTGHLYAGRRGTVVGDSASLGWLWVLYDGDDWPVLSRRRNLFLLEDVPAETSDGEWRKQAAALALRLLNEGFQGGDEPLVAAMDEIKRALERSAEWGPVVYGDPTPSTTVLVPDAIPKQFRFRGMLSSMYGIRVAEVATHVASASISPDLEEDAGGSWSILGWTPEVLIDGKLHELDGCDTPGAALDAIIRWASQRGLLIEMSLVEIPVIKPGKVEFVSKKKEESGD